MTINFTTTACGRHVCDSCNRLSQNPHTLYVTENVRNRPSALLESLTVICKPAPRRDASQSVRYGLAGSNESSNESQHGEDRPALGGTHRPIGNSLSVGKVAGA